MSENKRKYFQVYRERRPDTRFLVKGCITVNAGKTRTYVSTPHPHPSRRLRATFRSDGGPPGGRGVGSRV